MADLERITKVKIDGTEYSIETPIPPFPPIPPIPEDPHGSAEVILLADNWIADEEKGGFYQEVSVEKMLSTYVASLDILIDNVESIDMQNELWSHIYAATTADESVTVFSDAQLSQDITVIVKW